MANISDYPVKAGWSGGRGGAGHVATSDGHVDCDLAVPVEFKGPGNAANPEQLLTCAVASCYVITFGIIAENRKLPVESLELEAVGHVDVSTMLPKYIGVTLRPTIRVKAPTEEQKVTILDMAHKAETYCIVTNALRETVEITIEPTIVEV